MPQQLDFSQNITVAVQHAQLNMHVMQEVVAGIDRGKGQLKMSSGTLAIF